MPRKKRWIRKRAWTLDTDYPATSQGKMEAWKRAAHLRSIGNEATFRKEGKKYLVFVRV